MADLTVRISGQPVIRASDGRLLVLVETYHGDRLFGQQVIENVCA